MYIAGNYTLTSDGGCPSYGNTHTDILIEGNTVHDPGLNGDQGDGIDLKAGLINVTVRNNIVQNNHTVVGDDGGSGIVTSGVFGASVKANYLFEGNRFSGGSGSGILAGGLNGLVIRNNLIYNRGRSGILLSGDVSFTAATWRSITIPSTGIRQRPEHRLYQRH